MPHVTPCGAQVGLALFAFGVLPAVLWALARRPPLSTARAFSRALAVAFGTSSTAAALPAAMDCARALGVAPAVVDFVLPLGATVNMNGTALYEALTVIFLAQAHGVALGAGGVAVVAVTATLAAVGAAAIPSAGLVTMLMCLQAVGLGRFSGDLALILSLDWLLDRCRTTVNLLSDVLGAVLVDALCSAPDYAQLELV